jgi:DNA-binding SARP family transcriptional activator
MEFLLLGPVCATVDGAVVELGRRRERLLLSLLLLEAGQPLTVDRLIELLWDDELPRDPRGAVHVHLSRLRHRLAAAGAGRYGIAIVRDTAGYAIHADPGSVDVHRFADLVTRARDTADPVRRAEMLHRALALWRGDLLADVAPLALRQRLSSQLAELRLAALEMRVDTDLELGRHDALIPELASLSAEFPTRERLVAARMLALYRAGRQRDALAVYAEAAQALSEQLGLEPGAELRELRTAILRHDVRLASAAAFPAAVDPAAVDPAAAGPAAAPPAPAQPAQLPADVPAFVGRIPELAILTGAPGAQLATPAVVTITGMAGTGKTALAVRAGHQLATRYPGGQLFVELHGFTEGIEPVSPAAALDRMLRSLGVPADKIPEAQEDRAALYRSELADRRVLIVLDNAASESQVAPLLPGAPGSQVLITSRLALAGLDAASPLTLGVLSRSEATALFGRLLGDRSVAGQPSAAVADVVELCGRLPLAVRLAAARLRHRRSWSVADLAERLADVHGRLSELQAGERSVEAAIRLSAQCLTEPQRALFRALGLMRGSDTSSHAAGAAAAIEPGRAEQLLEQLVDAHLLEEPAPGRYQFHDLVRLYAARSATSAFSAADQQQSLDRLVSYYLSGASVAMYVLAPHQMRRPLPGRPPGIELPPLATEAQAQAWMDTELANLMALAMCSPGPELAACPGAIAEVLYPYLQNRAQFSDALRLYDHAVRDARGRGDDEAEATALVSLAVFQERTGRSSEARERLHEALVIRRRRGDTAEEGRALITLGYVCLNGGSHDEALTALTRAISLHRASGDGLGEEHALRVLSNLYWIIGRHAEAIAATQRAADLNHAAGFRTAEAYALINLGIYSNRLGQNLAALDHFERAAGLLEQVGDRSGRSHALTGLGSARAALGQSAQAYADFRAALNLAHETADRNAELEALLGLGDALRLAGDLDGALSHYQAALEVVMERGDPRDHVRALDGTARTLHAMGATAAARKHWERAVEQYAAADVLEVAEIRERLARIDETQPTSSGSQTASG